MFDLQTYFPQLKNPAFMVILSELIALGLVKDEGVGRYGGIGMTYFVPTENADWFFSWISE